MEFTHFNKYGRAHMVEVGEKEDTKRKAIARGKIRMKKDTIQKIKDGLMKKGDVLSVAQIGGIMGAKKTSDLIPMCHNIFLTGADIRFNILDDTIEVESEVKTVGKTGVEMEALTAVSLACLTIYDMSKAIDKDMVIEDIRLIKKTGGKTGDYVRKEVRGRVLSINISDKKGVVKEPIKEGLFIENSGLENDAHSGNWHRQVSLLGIESFEKMENQGIEGLVPGVFAENITTEGIILYELPVGTKLIIGETIQEVTQIGKECHTGCAIAKKVGKCVMPKEGIFTKVLKGGLIKEGDIIEII
ncbi:cyclic pyranopterin phosphate synthase [Tissierella praeacuta DSM 18095]|uniref:Cyclic pyranopterin monophosphate synthase n=1 Tax=Tissierella praeacuta DSM 18095 TaxID=1123404 RepID=A0A1M4TMQ2_9FIRM|nr:cyclic pyranopterin phosphate synthase [Tissierella praeacuta DSM 18095]SUP04486.1 Molybdenum cofactor biosynthesis protein C [Tissierella praeacuta]